MGVRKPSGVRWESWIEGALVHESSFSSSSATSQFLSGANREGFWDSKTRHPIDDVTGISRLGFL